MTTYLIVKWLSCSSSWIVKLWPNNSGDLKSDYWKLGSNWNPQILKIGFQMVRFFKGFCYSCVATIRKPDVFVYISNGFWQNDRRLSIKIWTICKTTSYYLLNSRRRDLRSPLYLTFFVRNSDSGLNLSSFRLHIEVHDPNIGLVHYSDCECICY